MSQNILRFQGGEPGDNWCYTIGGNTTTNGGGGVSNQTPRTGTNCLYLGDSTDPLNVRKVGFFTFDPVPVTGLNNLTLSFYTRTNPVIAGNGAGIDCGSGTADSISFQMSVNGGAFVEFANIRGGSDLSWNFTTPTLQCAGGCGSAIAGCGNAFPNPTVFSIPGTPNTIQLRLYFSKTRPQELLYFDDITLKTSSVIPTELPLAQAQNLQFSNIGHTQMDVAYNTPNTCPKPQGYLVLYKEGSPVSDVPVDGTTYTPGPFPGGTSSIAYVGPDTSGITLTGLTGCTLYHVAVYAWNNIPAGYRFLTASPLIGSQSSSTVAPPPPNGLKDTTVCVGQNLSMVATAPGAMIRWSGPNGFSSTLSTITIPNVSATEAGVYSVVAIANNCTSAAATATVTVNPIPAAPTAVTGATVCEGQTANLSATVPAGVNVLWTGPNSFSSTSTSPSLANAQPNQSGNYDVVAIENGCTSSVATAVLTVHPSAPSPTGLADTALCSGGTIVLDIDSLASTTYFWTGPNGFSTTLASVNLPNASAAMSGPYIVVAIANGCTSATATANVTVSNTPPVPLNVTGDTKCVGEAASLSATASPGTSLLWSGPNGFSSTQPNLSFPNVTPTEAGAYQVVSTTPSCTSAAVTVNLVVNPIPAAPAVPSDTTLCAGLNLKLGATPPAGASILWTGPNSFSSNGDTASLSNLTLGMAGAYRAFAIANGCTSSFAQTNISVLPQPAAPTGLAPNTVCSGGTINLSCNPPAGTTVLWSGPNGFSSTQTSPSIANATVADSGLYQVVAISAIGCTSTVASILAAVNTPPLLRIPEAPAQLCQGMGYTLCIPNVQPGVTYTLTIGSISQGLPVSDGQGGLCFNLTANTPGNLTHSVRATQGVCTLNLPDTTILITPQPQAQLTYSGGQACGSFMASLNVAGSRDFAELLLDPGDGSLPIRMTQLPSAPVVYEYTQAGTYSPVLRAINGPCTSVDSGLVTFTVKEQPSLNISTDVNLAEPVRADQDVQWTATVSPNSTVVTWRWPEGPDDAGLSVVHAFADISPSACVHIEAILGSCRTIIDTCVKVKSNALILPNVFSPNNDGLNETFGIQNPPVLQLFTLLIFNRWGQQVWAGNNPNQQWDGNMGSNPAPEGAYTWLMEYAYPNRQTVQRSGTVTLIR